MTPICSLSDQIGAFFLSAFSFCKIYEQKIVGYSPLGVRVVCQICQIYGIF